MDLGFVAMVVMTGLTLNVQMLKVKYIIIPDVYFCENVGCECFILSHNMYYGGN